MLIGCRGFACGCAPRCFGLRPRWRYGCCAVSQEVGADFAMGLDFCAVFGGGRSPSAPPTWENAGAARRFGPI